MSPSASYLSATRWIRGMDEPKSQVKAAEPSTAFLHLLQQALDLLQLVPIAGPVSLAQQFLRALKMGESLAGQVFLRLRRGWRGYKLCRIRRWLAAKNSLQGLF